MMMSVLEFVPFAQLGSEFNPFRLNFWLRFSVVVLMSWQTLGEWVEYERRMIVFFLYSNVIFLFSLSRWDDKTHFLRCRGFSFWGYLVTFKFWWCFSFSMFFLLWGYLVKFKFWWMAVSC
jgi:hypothetical protein